MWTKFKVRNIFVKFEAILKTQTNLKLWTCLKLQWIFENMNCFGNSEQILENESENWNTE